jgi:putative tricarboxylic transport membrane protein
MIIVLILIGTYSIRNSVFDVYQLLAFGVVGWVMRLLSLPAPPLVLGLVLGPMVEENFRRSLSLSDGSFAIFVERPISLTLLLLIIGVVLLQSGMALIQARQALKRDRS